VHATADADISVMRRSGFIIAIWIALPVFAATESARAQYDRDGRYVPSPNGIPSDPDARLVPMHPGTPGNAIGTPQLPRSAFPPAPRPVPRESPQARDVQIPSYRVPLTVKRCQGGWSPALGMARPEFTRRCKIVLSRSGQDS
jgi:hypothetical protein